MEGTYHQKLKTKIDYVVRKIYTLTKKFPREEIYGITSQLRRAILSVMLNYIEGFARNNNNVYKNFIEIAYGFLQESKYLVYISYTEKYMRREDYEELIKNYWTSRSNALELITRKKTGL